MQSCWSCLLVLKQLKKLENCYGDSIALSKSENFIMVVFQCKILFKYYINRRTVK